MDPFPHDKCFHVPYTLYNNNSACVQWTRNKTTRDIRHIQLQDNGVPKNIQCKHIIINHTAGKTNPSDIFTKEDKDKQHVIQLRNHAVTPCNTILYSPHNSVSIHSY